MRLCKIIMRDGEVHEGVLLVGVNNACKVGLNLVFRNDTPMNGQLTTEINTEDIHVIVWDTY